MGSRFVSTQIERSRSLGKNFANSSSKVKDGHPYGPVTEHGSSRVLRSAHVDAHILNRPSMSLLLAFSLKPEITSDRSLQGENHIKVLILSSGGGKCDVVSVMFLSATGAKVEKSSRSGVHA